MNEPSPARFQGFRKSLSTKERLERFLACVYFKAFSDVESYLFTPREVAVLKPYERLRYALNLLKVPGKEVEARKMLSSELHAQGYHVADFLSTLPTRNLAEPDVDFATMLLPKIEEYPRDLRSALLLIFLAAEGLYTNPQGDNAVYGAGLAVNGLEITQQRPEYAEFFTRLNALNVRGLILTSPQEVELDIVDGAVRNIGFADGLQVLHEYAEAQLLMRTPFAPHSHAQFQHVTEILIGAELHECASNYASRVARLIQNWVGAHEAVGFAAIASEQAKIAGVDSYGKDLHWGTLLALTSPAQAREILEKTLEKRLAEQGDPLDFSPWSSDELEALLALAQVQGNLAEESGSNDELDTAWERLIKARDIALINKDHHGAVDAMNTLADIFAPQGRKEELIAEIQRTLPSARIAARETSHGIKLIQHLGIFKGEMGNPDWFEFLEEANALSTRPLEKFSTQLAFARIYAKHERLDDALQSIARAYQIACENHDPRRASLALEMGSRYAQMLGDPKRGLSLLEQVFDIPDLPQNLVSYFATMLSDRYADIGNAEKARFWKQKATAT
ncbi:hypothetical protein CDES_00470 [Corynebacterium deserti GIMN1.010]|uniref:Tetratricopeptide repeat protein n=1 Tax=Corynebacterium deserti GIMN1.010 TaxID=931089 RepID=A0A0M4CDT3_9CORY|nr:hypothetical protein [Corynebacterium deserti]ALC04577.1 hypothetical protein CDES_00470 [Corynebacterium deserti GIMN1.010]